MPIKGTIMQKNTMNKETGIWLWLPGSTVSAITTDAMFVVIRFAIVHAVNNYN